MQEPLFHWSFIGKKIEVYPDRIRQQVIFGPEKSIPINSIASVEIGGYYSARVSVITNSGEEIKFMLMRHDKEKFRDAIYKAKEMQGKK